MHVCIRRISISVSSSRKPFYGKVFSISEIGLSKTCEPKRFTGLNEWIWETSLEETISYLVNISFSKTSRKSQSAKWMKPSYGRLLLGEPIYQVRQDNWTKTSWWSLACVQSKIVWCTFCLETNPLLVHVVSLFLSPSFWFKHAYPNAAQLFSALASTRKNCVGNLLAVNWISRII